MQLADRVVILDQGAKVFEESPDRLTGDDQVAIRYLSVEVYDFRLLRLGASASQASRAMSNVV